MVVEREHDAQYWRLYREELHRIRRMVDKYPAGHDLLTPAGWMLQYIVKDTNTADKNELLVKLAKIDLYQFREITPAETRELLYDVVGRLESAVPDDMTEKEQVILPKEQTTLW